MLARFDGTRFVIDSKLSQSVYATTKAEVERIEANMRSFRILDVRALAKYAEAIASPANLQSRAASSSQSPLPPPPPPPPLAQPKATSSRITTSRRRAQPAPAEILTSKRRPKPTEKFKAMNLGRKSASSTRRPGAVREVHLRIKLPALRPSTSQAPAAAPSPSPSRARMECVEIPVLRPRRSLTATSPTAPSRRNPPRPALPPRLQRQAAFATHPAAKQSAPAADQSRVDQLVAPLRTLYNRTVAEIAVLTRQLENVRAQETALTGVEFGAYAGVGLPPAATLEDFLAVQRGSEQASSGIE